MFTKNPVLSETGKTKISGSATTQYASAINEKKGNITINIGGEKMASFTSFTYGDYGNITSGKNGNDKYPDFGLKPFIVKRVGDADSAFVNNDPHVQSPSEYHQFDLTQKILFQSSEDTRHLLNLQISNSSDIPRYDRLTDQSNGSPVYAEWYYGPQKRNLASYNFSAEKLNGFFQQADITASYQHIEESRISRRFKSNNKDFRNEQVNIFGLNIDGKHYSGKNEIHLGAESYTNYVRSTAERMNIATQTPSRISTRYADGPTSMSYNGLYAQHTLRINNYWTLNDGIRINYVHLNAVFADTTLMHFPFKEAVQDNFAITGNIGIIYSTPENFKAAIVASSGFRSPNVDDLSKVFESQTGVLIVPNPDL